MDGGRRPVRRGLWDNALLGPTVNNGSFPDVLNTSGGTFAYKVCERGTTNCSNTASVTF